VTRDLEDESLLAHLHVADEALYQAWKKSIAGSTTMQEINRAQGIIHRLLRELEAAAKVEAS